MSAGRPRRAGICLHVSSLPGSQGIGDLGGCARELVDWMAAAGLAVWQFLPTGPTGYGNSPYQLLSAFAGNPLFIDVAELAEVGLLERSELDEAPSAHVDYPRVIERKERLLALAAERMARSTGHGLEAEYERFVAAQDPGWLADFALYTTLKRAHGLAPWVRWPVPYRDRDPRALSAWRREHRSELESVRRIQFLFFRQWAALHLYCSQRGIALFGDVPIYLAHDCADAWCARELLALDPEGNPLEVAGVPPDYFSAEGQRWGNPLYRWERHAERDYAWWTQRLRHAFARADVVRLDHFRGFEAYWAIPADRPAQDGQWRPGPGAALFEAIRRQLGPVAIVAEDLGVITEKVTALRRAFGMPGMKVLQFLLPDSAFDPDDIDEDCVCYTGTHDNDTAVGWFAGSGAPVGVRLAEWQRSIREKLQCVPGEVHTAMISLALASRAELAILPVQDLLGLGSEARMNLPGRAAGNWEWRLAPGQLDAAAAERLSAMIETGGRTPRPQGKE